MTALYIILGIIGWIGIGLFCMSVFLYINTKEVLLEDLFNEQILPICLLGPMLLIFGLVILPFIGASWLAENHGKIDIAWIVLLPWKIVSLPLTFAKWLVHINRSKSKENNDGHDMDRQADSEACGSK